MPRVHHGQVFRGAGFSETETRGARSAMPCNRLREQRSVSKLLERPIAELLKACCASLGGASVVVACPWNEARAFSFSSACRLECPADSAVVIEAA